MLSGYARFLCAVIGVFRRGVLSQWTISSTTEQKNTLARRPVIRLPLRQTSPPKLAKRPSDTNARTFLGGTKWLFVS